MSDGPTAGADARTSVVIATMDRSQELLSTLEHLVALPERPTVIVVDNASSDGSADAVRAVHPSMEVVELPRNLGAPGRNVGVAHATTPYVAFADDDSWWAPGALARAADVLDAHPQVGLVAARMLIGPDERLDPVSAEMAAGPPFPAADGVPGRGISGFLACGVVVRRSAFLSVGGFDDLLFFVGEEALLAYDLLAAGWSLTYVDDVVAHHHPSPVRSPGARRVRALRNDVLFDVMRRPAAVGARALLQLASAAPSDSEARAALLQAVPRLPRALARRRRPAAPVERQLAAVAPAAAAGGGVGHSM